MIKSIEYGELWSPYYQDWRDPFTEEQAQRKHAQKEFYTALVTESDGATVAVELCFAGAYCNLYFHDALGRNAIRCTYRPAIHAKSPLNWFDIVQVDLSHISEEKWGRLSQD